MKGYRYGKMYINVIRFWVWNTIKLFMYKNIMYEKSLSTYCILTHIFMTLSTIDWEEEKRIYYTNSTITDTDCHDDNINSNMPISW